MACCFDEIFRVANGRDGRVEIAFDLVADVLGAVAIFFHALADGEVGMFQAVVGDGVGAELLVGRACRASLDRTAGGGRSHMSFCCHLSLGRSRSVARTVAVGTCFGLRLLVPHLQAALKARCIDGIARGGRKARSGDFGATRCSQVPRSPSAQNGFLRPGRFVFLV